MMQYLGRSNSNCSSIRMDGGGRGVVPDPRYLLTPTQKEKCGSKGRLMKL